MKWVFVTALAVAAACGRIGFQPTGDDAELADGGARDGQLGDVDTATGDALADAPVDASSACQTAVACSMCFDDGATCPMTEGLCCECTGGQWQCVLPNPGSCPPTAPTVGDGCTAAGTQCHYDCDADVTWECNGTQWTLAFIASC